MKKKIHPKEKKINIWQSNGPRKSLCEHEWNNSWWARDNKNIKLQSKQLFFSFNLYHVKDILGIYLFACLQLSSWFCFEKRTV